MSIKRTALKRKAPLRKVGLSGAKKAHKKVKEKSVGWWKKRVWVEFSRYIRARDNGICYTCRKDMSGSRAYHAGHFISRRHNATLFDPINVHGQCMFCNLYDYGATGPYAQRLIEDYGLEAFQALLARSRQVKQFTVQELKDLHATYTQLTES